ncbi:MAG: exodeoxyribonuclease VII large subunit, partial [Chloroflexota bacterium]
MDQTWTVSTLTRYIRTTLETDYRLKELTVEGEISNVSRPASGHIYFTLKDSNASLRCVMWKSQAAQMIYRPRDGDRVEVRGSIGVYEASGQYQLYADSIRASGEGDLFREFTRLKAKLESEGLFDPARKRTLPLKPRRLCIVTSPTAAALRDILNIIRRRYPSLEVIICPTQVQGVDAPAQIVEAIDNANKLKPDVIIVARGGGSIEDLWAFNDEAVARAIAASPIPIICGVGHETDFTLADFAADVRAPTPSAAAEIATPDQSELIGDLRDLTNRLIAAIESQIQDRRWALSAHIASLRGLSPRAALANSRQRLDDLNLRAIHALQHRLELDRQRINITTQRLNSLSPLAILDRGYAIVTRADSTEVIRDAGEVKKDEK